MKNESNIYDIDDEIIREAGDNHKMTIEEASDKIEYYRKKLQEVEDTDPKAVKYMVYMRNLSQYIMSLYSKMSREELLERIEKAKNTENLDDQVKDAITELQNNLNNDTNTGVDTETEVSNQSSENTESNTDKNLRNDEVRERSNSDVHEGQSVSQEDILVNREINSTTMDEYVDYQEIEPVSIGGDNDGTND